MRNTNSAATGTNQENDRGPARRRPEPSHKAIRFANALWLIFATLAVLLFVCTRFDPLLASQTIFQCKTALALLAIALGSAVIRFLFGIRWRVNLLLVAFAVMAVEAMLQAVAWLGLLPAVNTKERLPWARVYWTAEGRGNAVRNRFGWHSPEFRLGLSNRVAVVGDSFVEAVEVKRSRNAAALLDRNARQSGFDRTILGLGAHGTGPAQYLETFQYGHRQFGIREAIFVVYLGNDITDCSGKLSARGGADYIVYSLGTNGALVLDRGGETARAGFRNSIEMPHRSPVVFLPRLVVSHCMLVQIPLSVRNTILMKRKLRQNPAGSPEPEVELAQLGLKAEPFAIEPTPAVREAKTILQSLLGKAAEYAVSNDIKLRIVTVPFFPQDFYKQQGTNWTVRLGNYDFLEPERELVAWAKGQGLPLLPLGQTMRARNMTAAQVRELYLSNGSGHFSEAGHRFAADAIWQSFFTTD